VESGQPQPSVPALRRFGLLVGGVFLALLVGVLPLIKHHPRPLWPWFPGGLLCAVALVAPRSLTGFYRRWMQLASALGWLNTRLLLTVVFFVVVTPIGLILRALGYNPMRRAAAFPDSHRRRSRAHDARQMEDPF
jgi:hypothetical protein